MMPQGIADDLVLLRTYADTADAGAFAELVRRHANMVYATARRVTGDTMAAEDVSQDCFLKLAQSSATVRDSLGAWLHRTSLNRSLELMRSDRSRHLREAQAVIRQQHEAEDESAQLIARVDEALERLPDELRVPITEHFLCGRTQTELAAALGVNQSTVQRRIEKGLLELRRRLHEEERSQSLASLPLLLAGFSKTAAPDTLRQGLIKIGLSGVRTGARATRKIVPVVLAAVFMATGVTFMFFGHHLLIPDATPNAPRSLMTSDQLPAAVRKTVDETAAGAKYGEIERKRDGERIVYDIDVIIDGVQFELRIAEDGRLIWKKRDVR
ncbi:MAG: sigma-70 family RNA polymerase sigma factor [Anaerolineae bacterium]|nr:sigma-70 family RNA polymerase sigma factor [Phycisphaerae bacterium]